MAPSAAGASAAASVAASARAHTQSVTTCSSQVAVTPPRRTTIIPHVYMICTWMGRDLWLHDTVWKLNNRDIVDIPAENTVTA